jgi:hypothetical protein
MELEVQHEQGGRQQGPPDRPPGHALVQQEEGESRAQVVGERHRLEQQTPGERHGEPRDQAVGGRLLVKPPAHQPGHKERAQSRRRAHHGPCRRSQPQGRVSGGRKRTGAEQGPAGVRPVARERQQDQRRRDPQRDHQDLPAVLGRGDRHQEGEPEQGPLLRGHGGPEQHGRRRRAPPEVRGDAPEHQGQRQDVLAMTEQDAHGPDGHRYQGGLDPGQPGPDPGRPQELPGPVQDQDPGGDDHRLVQRPHGGMADLGGEPFGQLPVGTDNGEGHQEDGVQRRHHQERGGPVKVGEPSGGHSVGPGQVHPRI